MSSMKKNVLAVALVAGLGLAGAAAAYTYGTLSQTAPNVDPVSYTHLDVYKRQAVNTGTAGPMDPPVPLLSLIHI